MGEWKIVFAGDAGVGKTSIIQYQVHGCDASRPYRATAGAAYGEISVSVEEADVLLQTWDTAGQETYMSLAPIYFRDAAGIVLVYDLTQESSFHRVRQWLDIALHSVDSNCAIFLVGNKADLVGDPWVATDSALEFAAKINATFTQTSAVTGNGIDELFFTIAKQMVIRHDEPSRAADEQISLNTQQSDCFC
jgi:small GTP-binding protein